MTQRLPTLRIATALALGIAIGAGAILATRPQVGDPPMGSIHTQMMPGHAAAMMSGGMMSRLHRDMESGPGTGSDDHHQASSSALPD